MKPDEKMQTYQSISGGSRKSQKDQIKELYMEAGGDTQDQAPLDKKHREWYSADSAFLTDEQLAMVRGISTSGLEYENIVFTKHDNGKLQYSLIPPLAEQEMVRVLTFGSNKYSANNWKNCDDTTRYIDAALRHIADYRMGKRTDEESRLHPLSHAMSCLSFVIDIELTSANN